MLADSTAPRQPRRGAQRGGPRLLRVPPRLPGRARSASRAISPIASRDMLRSVGGAGETARDSVSCQRHCGCVHAGPAVAGRCVSGPSCADWMHERPQCARATAAGRLTAAGPTAPRAAGSS